MTAVDVDALDKLREALARKLTTWVIGVAHENAWNCADVLVELPEVVELLAEVRRGRSLREAVDGLAEELDHYASKTTGGTYAGGLTDAAGHIRSTAAALRASNGEGTT